MSAGDWLDPTASPEELLAAAVEAEEDRLFDLIDRLGRELWRGQLQDTIDGCVLSTLLDIGRPDVMGAYRRWIDAGEVRT